MLRCALGVLFCVLPLAAQDQVEVWRADLDLLLEELPKRHKNLFFQLSEADWRGAGADLRARIDSDTDRAQMVAGLMTLIARVGDGHTAVRWYPQGGFPMLRAEFEAFAEGVFVLVYPQDESRLRGAELLQVGGLPVAEAMERIAPLVAADNEVGLRRGILDLLRCPALLAAVGIGDDPEGLQCRLRDAAGEEFDQTLRAYALPVIARVPIAVSMEKIPEHAQGQGLYWYRFLPEQKALYLRYNSCQDFEAFAALNQEMWESLEEDPELFVLDLRSNGGGNSRVIAPLFASLEEWGIGGDRIYTIIGRKTFSSAVLNALESKRRFGATLVGEDTPGRPNHYGEIRPLQLPGLGMTVFYSTKYFRMVEGDPPTIAPDVLVSVRAAEVFAGRDPFLDAVLRSHAERKE